MTDLERIARLLCSNDGYDPDARVFQVSALQIGVRGLPVVPLGEPIAQWIFYQEYAKATLDAVITGAEETDLRALIDSILAGEDIPEATQNELPVPPPAPHWRHKYHLV